MRSSSLSIETFSATLAQPTSPAPGGSTPAPNSSAAPLSQGQAQAALLTASEVGDQFTEGTYAATDKPLPCAAAGSPPFRLQVTPQAFAGKKLDHASPPAALNETIYVFADASAARRALSVGKNGFNCSTGTIYSAAGNAAPITIGQATDLSSDLPVDAGYAWVVQNKDVQGAQLAFVTGAVLVTLALITGAGTDTSALPNGLAVAKLAIAKIKNS